jgi:hypothetical protein
MTERRMELVNARKFLKKLRVDLPTLSQVHALRPGQWVKLILHASHGYGLWLEVTRVLGTGRFLGYNKWYEHPFPFTAKHVAEIQDEFELVDLTKEKGYKVADTPLEVGGWAKVGCVGRWGKREWFWVIVTNIHYEQYTGEIANQLHSRHTPNVYDPIAFTANNVLLVRTAAEMNQTISFDPAIGIDLDDLRRMWD